MTQEEQINKWFNQNYSHLQNEVKNNIANGQMSQYAEDLLSLCSETFLTKTKEQKQQMLEDNKIENFILFCCGFQIKLSSSPFYNTFRKHKLSTVVSPLINDNLLEDDSIHTEHTELYKCYLQARSELHWYHQKLLELKWDQGLTYDEIHKSTGITINSLRKDYTLIYKKIKKRCEYCY